MQTFEIENITLPALLFQMGYLTIDPVKSSDNIYQLRYPNNEAKGFLERHILAFITKRSTAQVHLLLNKISICLDNERWDELMQVLSSLLSHLPYPNFTRLYRRIP